MFEDGGSFRRRPRGFRKRPNIKGSDRSRYEGHAPQGHALQAQAPPPDSAYANPDSTSSTGSSRNRQFRYATPYDTPTGVLSPPPEYSSIQAPPPYYPSYTPTTCVGGSAYNFTYGATPLSPGGSATPSEYSYENRDGYNMVYLPPNPSTGGYGHFSLVAPQGHDAGGAANEATPPDLHGDNWQTPHAWVNSCANQLAIDGHGQQYTISNGFATPTDAELALSNPSGKKTL